MLQQQSSALRIPLVLMLLCLVGVLVLSPTSSTPTPALRVYTNVEISHVPEAGRRIAITFDAGGECDALPDLLAALASAKVHSTFFITGNWASKHPELVWKIHQGGHEVGNHSWSHFDFTQISDEAIRSEILRTDRVLARLVGRPVPPLFRAPYGVRDARVVGVLGGLGYRSIYWSLDSLDSVAPSKSSQFLIERVAAVSDEKLRGGIVLMHVGEPATATALPAILANLRQRKFKMLTVSELAAFQGQ